MASILLLPITILDDSQDGVVVREQGLDPGSNLCLAMKLRGLPWASSYLSINP